jgi:hypothetical protein
MSTQRQERRANAHNGKIVYWSEAEAQDAVDTLTARGQIGLNAYPCSYGAIGPHWHTGRSTARRGRRE